MTLRKGDVQNLRRRLERIEEPNRTPHKIRGVARHHNETVDAGGRQSNVSPVFVLVTEKPRPFCNDRPINRDNAIGERIFERLDSIKDLARIPVRASSGFRLPDVSRTV